MMGAATLSCVVFGFVFGGALVGALLRKTLPEHHLSADSKEIVKMGMGLIATMTALVLGLLVASAKSSYDTDKGEVVQLAAKIVFLDRVLANFGPETHDVRDVLRRSLTNAIERMWPDEKSQHSQLDPTASSAEELYKGILQLSPQNDTQQSLKAQAVSIASEIGQARWLLFEQSGSSISMPFLFVVVLWLTVIFISFSLFAPLNTTVLTTLLVCALSVSCAILLILELDQPFDGLIHISSSSMRNALAHLGK